MPGPARRQPACGRRPACVPAFARLQRREVLLLAAAGLLAVLALVAPALPQAAQYHHFADRRAWAGLPNAMDVLSNLAFLAAGLGGLWTLARAAVRTAGAAPPLRHAQAWMAGLFFGGLAVTAAVSAAYHWQPADAGLLWDRGGMVVAFAGLLGLCGLQAVSVRAGVALAAATLVLGPLSLQHWASSGNLLPWAALQAGGMAFIAGLSVRPAAVAPGLPVRWGAVLALYAAAKLCEAGDGWLFEVTGHLVSGHSLKHLFAAAAAWPVIAAFADLSAATPCAAHLRAESSNARRRPQALQRTNHKGQQA